MKVNKSQYDRTNGWRKISGEDFSEKSDLVLVFAATSLISDPDFMEKLVVSFPASHYSGCSTSGEICGAEVSDETACVVQIKFGSTTLLQKTLHIASATESYDAARSLVGEFPKQGLRHIFLLSDGLHVNGSELARGFREAAPVGVSITGGLAGDGSDFKNTFVLNSEGKAEQNIINAVAFYGDNLNIGFGSYGGWDSFGLERLVTRSEGNILYELDGQPALQLYKTFLGEEAKNLPAAGLGFPLNLRYSADNAPVVRTILGVDEEKQSITFAGDIPQGAYVRLMKTNIDHLIDGAVMAAKTTLGNMSKPGCQLAILISCVGRKLVMKQMVEEEVEGVRSVLGDHVLMCGFYSYGELSPFSKGADCELHNQTMTITSFCEN